MLEHSLRADVSLIKRRKPYKAGTQISRNQLARNFNPDCAMAGKITIVEVEEIVETGTLNPDEIHLPGILCSVSVSNSSPEKAYRKDDN